MKRYNVKYKDGKEEVHEYPEGYYMYWSVHDNHQLRLFHGTTLHAVLEDVLEYRITRINEDGTTKDFGPFIALDKPIIK